MLGPKLKGIVPGTLQDCLEFLNDLSWNLSWREEDGLLRLWGGEVLLFSGPRMEELEAFVFGMTLALAVLPQPMLDQIKELVEE